MNSEIWNLDKTLIVKWLIEFYVVLDLLIIFSNEIIKYFPKSVFEEWKNINAFWKKTKGVIVARFPFK